MICCALRIWECLILRGHTQIFIMSTQEHRSQPLTYSRSLRRRKTGLNVDLNAVPPSDNRDQVGPSTHSQSQDCEISQGHVPIPPAPIDVEAFDDDVIISSPRAFAEVLISFFSFIFSFSPLKFCNVAYLLGEWFLSLFWHSGIATSCVKDRLHLSQAKNNARRNRGRTIVVDVDSGKFHFRYIHRFNQLEFCNLEICPQLICLMILLHFDLDSSAAFMWPC